MVLVYYLLSSFCWKSSYQSFENARTHELMSAQNYLESAQKLTFWTGNLQNRHFFIFLAQFDYFVSKSDVFI